MTELLWEKKMDKMLIEGGSVLNGEVATSGAKNAALPILFSTLLAEGEHVFSNVPKLRDINSTAELLKSLGCETSWDGDQFKVKVKKAPSLEAHYDLVRKMRASILCLGPLLAKYGEAVVSMPGGCAIGTRPIDLQPLVEGAQQRTQAMCSTWHPLQCTRPTSEGRVG